MMMMENLDMVNRDPNNINDHLKTAFDDVLAEVDGTHSIDCIWKASYACFHGCKSCFYNIFTFFCGIWMACFWGLDFAVISFAHVWCVTPTLRMCMIHCNLCQKTFGTWINCCCAPCCEVFSLIFSNIRVEKK
uniref:Caveolin n=1 Tax=Magallana gigas TaxID=29159 RepID=A0A8W8LWY5_MAGGI|nr:caveolin-1 [Crassostrea gigas]|eukprot:XP_011423450.1 PREDICTED: caveolin-1 isoform X1 [Crassostrea gigas]